MKNLIALFVLSLVSTMSLQARASAYEEKALAQCGPYRLVQITVSALDITRKITTDVSYVVRSNLPEAKMQHQSFLDLDLFEGALHSDANIRISVSEEIGTGTTYRYQLTEWGEVGSVLLCEAL